MLSQPFFDVLVLYCSTLLFYCLWPQADPYVNLTVGKQVIKDRKNHVSKQLSPTFGRWASIIKSNYNPPMQFYLVHFFCGKFHVHSVHAPPPIPPQKKGSLTGTQFWDGSRWERGVSFFRRSGGAIFYIKNNLRSEILNDKKFY